MTLPDVTPPEDRDEVPAEPRYERAVEAGLVTLVVVLAACLGLPALVEGVREGTVELATVFYPVLLGAFAVLAWSRRTGP